MVACIQTSSLSKLKLLVSNVLISKLKIFHKKNTYFFTNLLQNRNI